MGKGQVGAEGNLFKTMRILDSISDASRDFLDMWRDGCGGKFCVIIGVTFGLALLWLCFILCDALTARYSEPFEAKVVERVYEPEHTSTGVGTANNGQMIITTSHEPEKFKAIVNIQGVTVSATCWPEGWAMLKKNSKVQCRYARGRFTGWNYGWAVTTIY